MIDCISGGRLIAGMVVGGGPEYYSFSINPAHARERFAEAHELVIARVDRARTVRVHRQALQAAIREHVAPPRAEAAPRDLDTGCRVSRDTGVRRPPPLRLHGDPLLPHRRVRPHVRHDASGV